jgi:hypothetical protein
MTAYAVQQALIVGNGTVAVVSFSGGFRKIVIGGWTRGMVLKIATLLRPPLCEYPNFNQGR